jgi:hypothetical protein
MMLVYFRNGATEVLPGNYVQIEYDSFFGPIDTFRGIVTRTKPNRLRVVRDKKAPPAKTYFNRRINRLDVIEE